MKEPFCRLNVKADLPGKLIAYLTGLLEGISPPKERNRKRPKRCLTLAEVCLHRDHCTEA